MTNVNRVWSCPHCQTVYPNRPKRCICALQPRRQRITESLIAQSEQWAKDRDAYIAEHGQAAYDAKLERDIKTLYP